MNSFTLHAVGQLASDPELTLGKAKDDTPYVRFSLLGNDYGGKGRDEIVTRVFFVAFGGLAEAIGKNARKGDQLILEAQLRASNRTDEKTGETIYDYSYIVQGFRYGKPGRMRRAQLEARSKAATAGA